MIIRRFREQDRGGALTLLRDARAIDSPGHHLHVIEEAGDIKGVALWLETGEGTGQLAAVQVAPGEDRSTFYRLAAAACKDAIDQGVTQGSFILRSKALVQRLEQDFKIDVRPSGWQANSDTPVEWEVTVDLQDALKQLQGFT